MGRVKKESLEEFRGYMVSPKQHAFLLHFQDTASIDKACKACGMRKDKLKDAVAREGTDFSSAYTSVLKGIEKSYEFSKVKNLSELAEMRDTMMEKAKLELQKPKGKIGDAAFAFNSALKAIQEINKMQEGNLAATKKVNENVDISFSAKIDLTKEEDEDKMIDISHEEID
jgi:hypothetical protein